MPDTFQYSRSLNPHLLTIAIHSILFFFWMANLRSQTRQSAQGNGVEVPNRVALWLSELKINDTEAEANELNEKQRERYEPITPPRRPSLPAALDNISPTDTSFANRSIFDTSSATRQQLEITDRKEEALDYASDIISIDGNEPETGHRIASLDWYDPPLEVESVVDSAARRSFTAQDPFKPRIIWLTSCLQCTLADLPCSRTVPACSRCKRNGNTLTCLLQHCWFGGDIAHVSATGIRLPVLLRLKSDDDEAWHRKSELAKNLLDTWEAEHEKKNWVLPSIENMRGHYPIFGSSTKQVHPGEGRGILKERFKYAPLEVCLE